MDVAGLIRRQIAPVLLLAAAYFVAAYFSLRLNLIRDHVLLFWPPSGLALAVLLAVGLRIWPGVALGAFLVDWFLYPHMHEAIPAVALVLGNTLGPAVSAWLLRHRYSIRLQLDRLRDVAGFLLIAVLLGNALGALFGALTVQSALYPDWSRFWIVWLKWFGAHAVAIAVITPFVLVWTTRGRRKFSRRRFAESGFIAGCVLVISYVIFLSPAALVLKDYPLTFTLYPFIVWAALRFGQVGASTCILFTSSIAVWGTTHGTGPFGADKPQESIMLLASFLMVIAGVGLIVAAMTTERLEVLRSLQMSERRYRVLFEENVAGVFFSTVDGSSRGGNQAFARVFGYSSPEEAAAAPENDFFAEPQDLAAYLERLRECGTLSDYELKFRRKDGTRGVAIGNVRLMPNEFGEPNLILGTIVDITSRKEAEAALRASEERFRAIFERTDVGISRADLNGRYTLVNSRLAKMLGRHPEELVGRTFLEFTHPDDQGTNEDIFRRCLDGDLPGYTLEKRYVTSDGGTVWVLITATLLHTADGTPESLIGVVLDITERKRSELLRDGYNKVLESLATGKPLKTVLTELVHAIESQGEEARASVLLLSEDRKQLYTGAAPSLPEAYNLAVDGLEVGPGVGSCGTAAYERRIVIVEDTAIDPLWASYRDLAQVHGLRACWSHPVLSSEGGVLGTLAIYYSKPRRPTEEELRLIASAAHLAGVAIEYSRAREAIQNSEQQLRLAFESARMGAWNWQIQEGKTWASWEMGPLFGRLPNDPPKTYEAFLEAVHPEDRQAVAAAVRRTIDSGGSYRVDYRVQWPDGTLHWLSSHGLLHRIGPGQTARLAGITMDITLQCEAQAVLRRSHEELERLIGARTTEVQEANTRLTREIAERKEIERALRQHAAEITDLYDNAPCGYHSVDVNGVFLKMNNTERSWLGYSREEIVGRMKFPDILTPASKEVFLRGFPRYLEKGAVTGLQLELVRKDGSLIPVLMTSTAVWDENRKFVMSRTTLFDMTEIRRVHQALFESEERFRQLYEATLDGMIIHEQATMLEVNEALAKMFGYERGELIGRPRLVLIAPEAWDFMKETIMVAMSDDAPGAQESHETIGIRKDGSRFPIEIRSKAIPYRERMVRVTAVRDLTERKLAEERANQHREELAHVLRLSTMGEMATGLAHELNQPLSAIVNYTQGSARRLRESHPNYGDIVTAIENAAKQAQRAGEIIRRLRDLTRKREPDAAETEINRLIHEAVGFVTQEAKRHGVHIEIVSHSPSATIRIDAIQIEQVIINLVKNAIEASRDLPPDRRRIRVDSGPGMPGEFNILVRDEGSGLSKETLGKLFEAFYTTKPRGMGMGLSISRSIVEAHGGRMWAQNNVDGGATFGFALPAENGELGR